MITDREQLEALLRKAGIGFEVKEHEYKRADEWIDTLELRAKEHPRVNGYMGFLTEMLFDSKGNLMEIGAWE